MALRLCIEGVKQVLVGQGAGKIYEHSFGLSKYVQHLSKQVGYNAIRSYSSPIFEFVLSIVLFSPIGTFDAHSCNFFCRSVNSFITPESTKIFF